MNETGGSRNYFPTTPWDDVNLVVDGVTGPENRALADLLELYMPAMRGFVLRALNIAPADADDILQAFVVEKILEQDVIRRADSSRGRFRDLLRQALRHFVVDRRRRRNAAKRRPRGGRVLGPEALDGRSTDGLAPDEAFELEWARTIVRLAYERTQAACRESGRLDVLTVFEARIWHPIMQGADPEPYKLLVERLGIESPSRASNLLTTAKRTFARSLRAVVAEYAGDENDIDAEIRELHAILQHIGA